MLKCTCFVDGGIMYLEPKNRHLLILPIEDDEKEKTVILLPEDYRRPQSPYITCDVLGVADNCEVDIVVGDRIIIERRMMLEIKAAGETNYLVLENYVYGRLQDE
jgi:co-chaperonin GroES (HSP10)